MAQITVDHHEAELALGLDHREEGLDHRRKRIVFDPFAPLQPFLIKRSGAHLALHHDIIASQGIERAGKGFRRRVIQPKGGNGRNAPVCESLKIGLPAVPSYEGRRIEDRTANRFKPGESHQKCLLIIPIIPGGANESGIKAMGAKVRITPVHFHKLVAKRAQGRLQGGDLIVMLMGVGSAVWRAGQGDTTGKERNLHQNRLTLSKMPDKGSRLLPVKSGPSTSLDDET